MGITSTAVVAEAGADPVMRAGAFAGGCKACCEDETDAAMEEDRVATSVAEDTETAADWEAEAEVAAEADTEAEAAGTRDAGGTGSVPGSRRAGICDKLAEAVAERRGRAWLKVGKASAGSVERD